MKVTAVLAAALTVCTASVGRAQTADRAPPMSAAAVAEAERAISPFLTGIQAGDAQAAYTRFFAGTLLAERTVELNGLAGQHTVLNQAIGRLQNWSLRDASCVTPRACRMRYVLHHERGPVGLWIFVYRTEAGAWLPVSLNFGSDLPFFFD